MVPLTITDSKTGEQLVKKEFETTADAYEAAYVFNLFDGRAISCCVSRETEFWAVPEPWTDTTTPHS